jgi:predicted ABC-class ATPase
MGMYGSLFSQKSVLNEQIARQVFDILPENGPIMVIADKDGNYWPSDSERFAGLNISESFLKELCAKIDDGTEPLVTQHADHSIIAAQLSAEHTSCGYVLVAVPQSGPQSNLLNIDLIEILLNQVCLIAKLIEKNNILYELQMKHFSAFGKSEVGSN